MSGVVRPRTTIVRALNTVAAAFIAAVGRLDKSLSPSVTLTKLRNHNFVLSDCMFIFHALLATFWFTVMEHPGFPIKLLLPILWIIALLIPLTSQFFIPATPIFTYLLSFYSARFVPGPWRPEISVVLLPTLEYVLYGANISDILTRFTHPVLDIIAWFPYGVGHFVFPFVVAAFIWLFRSKEVLHLWGKAFGYLNVTGVLFQIVFPCSAPWYELIHGLTPANYSMKGSPGGLARIDALFHGQGYTVTFSNSPVVFGAFPSLHAACATMEALFLSHFFPQTTRYVWAYAGILYWATMYLTHHYLIDVVGGACLATAYFYLFLPDELKGAGATAPPGGLASALRNSSSVGGGGRSKYEIYDLEDPRRRRVGNGSVIHDAAEFEISETSSDDEEMDITYRSPGITPTPASVKPLLNGSAPGKGNENESRVSGQAGVGGRKSHRHTASIASLIRGDERGPEDGWSPVTSSFVAPPATAARDRSRD
ncbi:PAP2-domain-containing protein [Macrolepiota fuliginosa MF-IS2]|uniref:PAP2-domain-containing protein n=1 Tax=Macrolepiota fuliginosa MF-IS2 TaxID=1400762 RepID=A0A9P5X2L4_9AGAR|nr:PAP2-domain-containing protein [Macrolepiota fuliginosa MF-IS2]